ncbi:MAG: anti-sigma F factor [Halanaerobiaceae bacterium]
MKNHAELIISGRSENVGLARIAAATFASELDFTLSELEEIKVAVSEAVSNCIIHGYPDETGQVEIEMIIEGDQLIITVTDYGVGISDVEAVLQPAYTTKDEHMGLGLAFIDSFMESFELESEIDGGTVVTMKKSPEKVKNAVE